MALTVPVLDISEFQGTVDAPAIAAAGIRHAIVRCADPSRTPPEDPRYEDNVANLLACGVTCDAYVFVRTYKGSAVNEAERYTRWARRANVGRLWLDCEVGSEGQMTAATTARWLLDLVLDLEDSGWRDLLGIYTNASYWNLRVGPAADSLGRLPFWVATYPRSTPPPADPREWVTWVASMRAPGPARPWLSAGYVGWQFASNGTQVDGHKVDCNLFDPDFLYPPAPPVDGPKTIEVKPMYDPPLGPIVASCPGPVGLGALLLGADGGVYVVGGAPVTVPAGWTIGPHGQSYFDGRVPALIAFSDTSGRWTVTATSGEEYDYPHP